MDAAACIGCGACVAACPNASAMLFVAAKVSHLGLLPQGQPERDAPRARRWSTQMDAEGFGNCTNQYECEAACPKEIRSSSSPGSTASSSGRRSAPTNTNEKFDVSPGKVEALFARIARLGVDVKVIEEGFSRGGGKGGQKINKTSNRVQLYYPPLDLGVSCQRERKRSLNRFLALRELVDQIEMKVSPRTSERLKDVVKLRKKKARKAVRSQLKYSQNA